MSDYSFHLDKGVQESKANQYPAALKSFSKAIDLNGNSKAAYLNHGALCNQSRLYDVAIEDFTLVLEIDPWDIPAHFNRFLSHFAKLDHKAALKDLYIAVSLAYTKQGELQHSIQHLEEAIALVPNNALAYLMKAREERTGGKYQQAMSSIGRVLKECPNYKEGYAQRAALFRRLRDNEKCQQDIQRVLELSKTPNRCQIDLVPVAFQDNSEWIQNQLKDKYRLFMELRNIIYTRNQRSQQHLRVLAKFSQVHRQAGRSESQFNPKNDVSISGLSRLQWQIANFKKNVQQDKIQLNNSINESFRKRSDSQFQVNSTGKRKFVFTNGKTNQFQQSLQAQGLLETKPKEQKKRFNMTTRELYDLIDMTEDKDETRSDTMNFIGGSVRKKGSYSKLPKTSNRIRTEQNEQQFQFMKVKILSVLLDQDQGVVKPIRRYCLVEYGRHKSPLVVATGVEPVQNNVSKFQLKKSRELFSLKVFSKETLNSENLVGEAVVSVKGVDTKADLKSGEFRVGVIMFEVRYS